MRNQRKVSPLLVCLPGRICLSTLLLLFAVAVAGRAQIVPAGPEPPTYDTPPELIHQEQGRYTATARQEGKVGTVTVQLIVDVNGLPSHVRVVHGLGMGLDERAVEAVRQDRFKPATKDGKAVPANMKLELTFDPALNPGP
jgi:TonB family protein